MNTIKTCLAAILLLAVSCKKENNTIPSSGIVDRSSTSELINGVTGKYPSVLIGTQRWMIKNLEVSHYRNGDRIPQVKNPTKWAALTTGAWCWYNNDSTTGAVYGKLYNWYAVNDPRGLAPIGWHVPSYTEWVTLSRYLGGDLADAVAGGPLKETDTTHWYYPNAGATNSTGFTALPGGFRISFIGDFYNLRSRGYWWTSTQYNATTAWLRIMDADMGDLPNSMAVFANGMSVRCIKD